MSNDGPSEKTKALIDENLRRVFHKVVEEPLPPRFAELLDKLRSGSSEPPGDAT